MPPMYCDMYVVFLEGKAVEFIMGVFGMTWMKGVSEIVGGSVGKWKNNKSCWWRDRSLN